MFPSVYIHHTYMQELPSSLQFSPSHEANLSRQHAYGQYHRNSSQWSPEASMEYKISILNYVWSCIWNS